MLAAYAFARLEFPGRDGLFSVYLATLMVPNIVTLVPLYTMMREVHLTNTYWAIFLPYVLGTPYTIFLMRQYFRSLPADVFAAARVDGCSEWQDPDPDPDPDGAADHRHGHAHRVRLRLEQLPVAADRDRHHLQQVLTVGIAGLQSCFVQQWNLVLAASLVALVPLLVIFAAVPAADRAIHPALRRQPLNLRRSKAPDD